MNMVAKLNTDITPDGSDYETVRRVIELITEDYRDQPSLETMAARLTVHRNDPEHFFIERSELKAGLAALARRLEQ